MLIYLSVHPFLEGNRLHDENGTADIVLDTSLPEADIPE
jgi:hypothetical protein